MLQRKSILADLILLLVTFVWGLTFVLVKKATSTMPPFTFLGVRFLMGAVILFLIILFWRRDLFYKTDRKQLLAGVLTGCWLFAGYAFQTFGLQYTSASKSGFITGLSVVLVPILSVWLLRIRPTKQNILGVMVATVGLALLSFDKTEAANIGDLLTLFCALSFGMHIIMVGKYATRYHALSLALYQIFTVGVLNMIGAFLFENWQSGLTKDVLFDGTVFSSLLITAVFATALAFVAQTQFQKFTTPTRTALIFSTEPVFAAAAAYFFGEILSGQAILGCVCILLGMVIAEMGGHEEPDGRPVTEIA